MLAMDYTDTIIDLYDAVLQNQMRKFRVQVRNLRRANQNMKEAYLPNPGWEWADAVKLADYNDGAHRCAYLHKHAMLHTGLVCSLLQSAFKNRSISQNINSKRKLNLCSLGGGPGADVIALLMILREFFGFIQCNVSIVDCAIEWKHVFDAVIAELKTGCYGEVKDMVDSWYFTYEYLKVDLLELHMSYYDKYRVHSAITNADIITMVKFVSAAACNKTRQMLKSVFKFMKPGAIVLFVDNAAGGFYEMVEETAESCGMLSVFGPCKHLEYEEPRFSRTLYGYTSQSKTKVTVEIWKKMQVNPYDTSFQLQCDYVYSQPSRPNRVQLRRQKSEESESCCSIM